MDCSFFILASLFALRFATRNNFLASAMLKRAWHCSRLYLYSAALRTITSSPRQCLSKLSTALGSLLFNLFEVCVLNVVACVLRTTLSAATTSTAVRVCLSTTLSSVSSIVHVLASSVECVV